MAQWIRRVPPKHKILGSSPSRSFFFLPAQNELQHDPAPILRNKPLTHTCTLVSNVSRITLSRNNVLNNRHICDIFGENCDQVPSFCPQAHFSVALARQMRDDPVERLCFVVNKLSSHQHLCSDVLSLFEPGNLLLKGFHRRSAQATMKDQMSHGEDSSTPRSSRHTAHGHC